MIDMRSDTTTVPSRPMLEAMFASPVGDDAFAKTRLPIVNIQVPWPAVVAGRRLRRDRGGLEVLPAGSACRVAYGGSALMECRCARYA